MGVHKKWNKAAKIADQEHQEGLMSTGIHSNNAKVIVAAQK
jgi:hypothetical protein